MWTLALRFGPYLVLARITRVLLPGRGHSVHGDCSHPLDSQQQGAADQSPHAAHHCSAACGAAGSAGDRQDQGRGQRQLLLPPLLRHPRLGDGAHRHRSE